MDASFVESFFQAVMKEEPLDYCDVDFENEYCFKVKDESNSSKLFNFADVQIKQEILDEPEDDCMTNAFPETVGVQHFTDHTYANMSLDIHIKEQPTDQIETEHLVEENTHNFVDITNIINNLESSRSANDMMQEEIDFPLYEGLREFHDFVNKTNIKEQDLVINEKATNNDNTEFLKYKPLDEVTFKCKHCYYTFKSFSELQKHTQKHFIKNTYKCKNCIEEFATLKDLVKHELTHLEDKVFSCNVCKNIYFTISSYTAHLKWHLCPNCNEVFTKRQMKIAHQKICKIKENIQTKTKEHINDLHDHYDQPLAILDYNSNDSLSKSNYTENIPQNLFEIQCKYCSKIFKNVLLLEQHMQNDHYVEELVQCDYCDEKFTSQWDKVKHMIIHRNEFKKKTTKIGNLLRNYNQQVKLKRKSLVENLLTSDEQDNKLIKLSENLISDNPLVDKNMKSDIFLQEFPVLKEIITPLERCDINNLPRSDEQNNKLMKFSENLIPPDQVVDKNMKSDIILQEFPVLKEIITPLERCDINNLPRSDEQNNKLMKFSENLIPPDQVVDKNMKSDIFLQEFPVLKELIIPLERCNRNNLLRSNEQDNKLMKFSENLISADQVVDKNRKSNMFLQEFPFLKELIIPLERCDINNLLRSDDQDNKLMKFSESLISADQVVDKNMKSDIKLQEFPLQKEIIVPLERCDIDNLQCKICEKIFINSKAKNMHMNIHKLCFVCNVCGESFMSKKALVVHMRDHVEQDK